MGRVTFIEHNGTQHEVDIEEGKTLMQTATDNGVPGIDADCGGACACGTCHVIVDRNWIAATGAVYAEEKQMLEMTPEKADTSRLACQISMTEAMDGLVVRLPEFQM
ncbi:2Fe-2S iron-sulfur cluster-binding protein [Ketobacter alkanivorans]|uniref:2Fe-2S ferredoxin n=1 Tax=Ketobacter alkanivorans TaxID=1917421 RepID=A0A2K9LKT8_9GAMM|nr:2Fe-2S iron-sulfur cluster-binding protein [Ketobacter alkanivorans]AUM12880.1 2Fe-2S ferredoxin [Ketobacter alkanivorans]MCP5014495.1 2Fe-2S iron-sulfur cluster binding domain-containing protein [Ketobacter sp.]